MTQVSLNEKLAALSGAKTEQENLPGNISLSQNQLSQLTIDLTTAQATL